MKAYAVRFCDEYWLVHAPNHTKAKGHVIRSSFHADPQYMKHFKGLRCRRWPTLDTTDDRQNTQYWGIPGTRDYESGTRIEIPSPFKR